jgi:hypothetical protein
VICIRDGFSRAISRSFSIAPLGAVFARLSFPQPARLEASPALPGQNSRAWNDLILIPRKLQRNSRSPMPDHRRNRNVVLRARGMMVEHVPAHQIADGSSD